jgi:hypothetical protein
MAAAGSLKIEIKKSFLTKSSGGVSEQFSIGQHDNGAHGRARVTQSISVL